MPETVRLVTVVVASVEVRLAVKFVTVVVAKVETPVTLNVPPIVALPDIARLAPVIAAVTATSVNVPVVANKLVLVAFVNTPVDGTVAPIGLLSIVPPDIVSPGTTMASVTELLGNERVFVTVRLPIFAVPMVELAAVVVAKVLAPVKILFAFNKQIFEASERSAVESPTMVAADTSSVFETVRLVVETFVIVALLAVTVPAVANVKFPFVANRFVPVALVQSNASKVPSAARRFEALKFVEVTFVVISPAVEVPPAKVIALSVVAPASVTCCKVGVVKLGSAISDHLNVGPDPVVETMSTLPASVPVVESIFVPPW